MDSSVVHLLHFMIYLGFYSDTFKADSTDGGALKIKDFFKAAEEGNRWHFENVFMQYFKFKFYEFLVCKIPNPDQAFACLDMTYISALLHHGFGLGLDTKLQVKNKIVLTIQKSLN